MDIYIGQNDKSVFPTTHTACVVSAGEMEYLRTGDCTVLRVNGRKDWSLFYVTNGLLHLEGFPSLKKGELFIYPAEIYQRYTVFESEKTNYRYVHFTGENLENLFEQLKIPTLSVIKVDLSLMTEIFDKVETYSYCSDPLSMLKAEHHFLRLLSLISEVYVQTPKHSINSITEEMRKNFKNPYDASYYASKVNLSVSRFNHVFKKETGISPLNFYNSLRIENAKNLLSYTDMKVGKIAENSGYTDVLYFSKAFKKSVGVSPSEFRNFGGNRKDK